VASTEIRGTAGFTLIEAMVALAIVALGMMAVNTQLNRYAATAAYIEQKTLASWIATNKVTELSVAGQWPEIGISDEDCDEGLEFASRQWHCSIKVSETPVPNLRRVDVSVSLASDPDRTLDTVTGLLEPPLPAGFAPVRWMTPGGGTGG
jgi:general secretion pathway protein I